MGFDARHLTHLFVRGLCHMGRIVGGSSRRSTKPVMNTEGGNP
jgi:hypothetical protein